MGFIWFPGRFTINLTINMGKTILFHIQTYHCSLHSFRPDFTQEYHEATKPQQIEAYLSNIETCATYLWIIFHLVRTCLSFLALVIFPNTFEKQKAIHAMSGVSFAPNLVALTAEIENTSPRPSWTFETTKELKIHNYFFCKVLSWFCICIYIQLYIYIQFYIYMPLYICIIY